MKRCTKCGEEKELSAFSLAPIQADPTRRNPLCKPCINTRRRERWAREKRNRTSMVCNRCGVEKAISEFKKYPKRGGVGFRRCLSCLAERLKPRSREAFLRLYGLTPAQGDQLVLRHEGRCAICETPFQKANCCHVDHDHETGVNRGLLCASCNTGIGQLERPGFLSAGIAYLAQWKGLPQTAP